RRLDAVANASISLEVDRRQARVGLVPDLRRHLMAAQILFELSFVAAAVEEQPPGPRIPDAVAEDDVQAEADLVDEVVHVALEAAVVVAGEEDPSRAGDERPPREMNRAHASQTTARVDVSGTVVDRKQHEPRDPEPEEAGLEAAHGAELIGDVVVF